MIVVDTNIISEPFKRQPEKRVLDWLDGQAPETLYLASISLAEILTGIETAPEGRFQRELRQGVADLLARVFAGRILPFDAAAAHRYAQIQGQAKRAGQGIGVTDGQIAAIAMQRGFAVATRDVHPFQVAGVMVINPWKE